MKVIEAPANEEPPSCGSSVVLIGKNSRGNWVAQEQHGLYGGLFVDRVAAVRYALFENGHHPEAIVSVPTILELEMDAARSSLNSAPHIVRMPQRRVA